MTDLTKSPPAAEEAAAKSSEENNTCQPVADEQPHRNQDDDNNEEQGTIVFHHGASAATVHVPPAVPASTEETRGISDGSRNSIDFSLPGAYRVDPIRPLVVDPPAPLQEEEEEEAAIPSVHEADVELTPHLHEAWVVDGDVQVAVEIICDDEPEDEHGGEQTNDTANVDEEQGLSEVDEASQDGSLYSSESESGKRVGLLKNPRHVLAVLLAIMVSGGIIAAVAISVNNKNERGEGDEATTTAEETTIPLSPPTMNEGDQVEQDALLLDNSTFSTSLGSTVIMDDGRSIYAPPMPPEISDILAVKAGLYRIGVLAPLAFSRDCSIVATSLVDEWKAIVQTIQYNESDGEWTLLGEKMDEGKTPGDRFGAFLDLSDDGAVMAVASPRDDPNKMPDAGSVRVYCRGCSDSSTSQKAWNPMGSDIHGKYDHGWFGTTLSLSADGTMVAAAASRADNEAGRVRVHRFNASDNEWKQVGSDIVGEGDMSSSHSRLTFVKMSSDGNTLAVGAHLHSTTEKDYAKAGSVRILRLNNPSTEEEEWVQVGDSIYGKADNEQYGIHPLISDDGSTIAFSGLGSNGFVAFVYRYNKELDRWAQVGGNYEKMACIRLLRDGSAAIFCSVSMSSCSVFSSDHEGSNDNWKEMTSFDAKRFIPLSFSRDDGKEVCGIVQQDIPGSDNAKFTIGMVPF